MCCLFVVFVFARAHMHALIVIHLCVDKAKVGTGFN